VLEGIRVVELSADVSGSFAGRLLAAYGADVIVVEPPGGHPVRSLPPRAGDSPDESILFAYLGAGKRSVVLDISNDDNAAQVRRLIARADVVIDSYAAGELAGFGLDPESLLSAQRSLVVCSITPYGQDGPHSHWRATSLTGSAAGGQMSICGDADKPPLKQAGHQADYQAGLHAFSAIVTALYAAKQTGVGDWLDISMQEVQTSTVEGAGPNAMNVGSEAGRNAGNTPFAQWGIHPCKGGYIGVAAMPRQSFAVYDCIGHPELKEDPAFASGWALEANEVLKVLIPEWTAERTAKEIFDYAAKFRAPFSMIPNARELLEWPGLTAVGFWKEVEHPVLGKHPLPSAPIEFADGSRGLAKRAPLVGEHTKEILAEAAARELSATRSSQAAHTGLPLALDGIRVIDMTAVWAGPYGTRFLGDHGAEVIKVEGPSAADPVRTMTGARTSPEINQSFYFNEYSRNKLGISLDIKQPEGMAALKRLIATADVFIENWSSGVADRLGLGFEALKQIKPDIVYISMPGFGHKGPDAERIGFGPTIEQMGGLVALQGYEDGPPHRSGISYGDPISGTIAAGAVAMGLLERAKTGKAFYAAIPQRDAIPSLIGEYILGEALGRPLPVQIGNRDAEMAPHNVYQAKDTEPRAALGAMGRPLVEFVDSWVAIAVDSEAAWAGLKSVIGDGRLEDPRFDTMAGRRAAAEEIDAIIEAWTVARDAGEAAALLQSAGVAASPVLSPVMMTTDEHLLERGFFMPFQHADIGDCITSRPAWRFKNRPPRPIRAAPRFGEHTREVLKRVGGYSEAELEAFAAKNVITDDLIAGAAG